MIQFSKPAFAGGTKPVAASIRINRIRIFELFFESI